MNLAAFQRSTQALIDRHASLRVTIMEIEGEPRQRVKQYAESYFDHQDASAWDESLLAERLVEEAHRPFDLESGPLMRVAIFTRSEDERVLLLALHHIAADFWSLAVMLNELAVLYEAEKRGVSISLPPLTSRYSDYVRWQDEMLAGERGQELWEYWRTQLSGELPLLNLPTDRPRPPVQTYQGGSEPFELSPALARKLKRLCRSNDATLFMVLLAAFQTLLHRYTGQDDILTGTPSMGRTRAEFAGLVGYFVNTLALRADLSGDPCFNDFLIQTRSRVLASFEHQDYPFGLLVEKLKPKRDPSYSPIFQTMLVLHKSHLLDEEGIALLALGKAGARTRFSDLVFEPVPLTRQVAQASLTLMMAEAGQSLVGSFQYNTDLFDRPTIIRLVGHFKNLLGEISANPQQRISTYQLLTEGERKQLLTDWNNTRRDYPPSDCIHHLFERQAEERPEADAVIFGAEQLTYGELDRRANQIAHYLRRLGVRPETRVGICSRRSLAMIVAMLGVLKAGGTYVPLDPAYPKQRINYMLEDAEIAVLLTEENLLEDLPKNLTQIVFLDSGWDAIIGEEDSNPASKVSPQNLAYIIYTSGSTGDPKGVAIEHRSAATLIRWAKEVFSAEELAGVLASTSVCFDLSIFELFVPLSLGGKVVLAENILELPSLPSAREVTLINTVPSAMAELIRVAGVPSTVSTVNLAGEALPERLVEQVYRQTNARRVFNLYGPSEDTTYSTFGLMREGEPPTIGRPVANTQVYVLDANLQPVPVGIGGELYIAGEGLARCYLNHPGLTAEKFVPDPFGQTGGCRLYKTGDLAKYRPDGNLEFLGRIDHQVKLRGFRIELGEVEAALTSHPLVKESVALLKEDATGDKWIVAYIVARVTPEPSSFDVQQFIRERLPDYMMPSAIMFLDALPLTVNGKIDRKALPEIDFHHPPPSASYRAPRTEIEKIITGIWAELLAVERVGIDDNFFDLGGHSLLLLRVQKELQSRLGCELSAVELLQFTTITSLAEHLANGRKADASTVQGASLPERLKEGKARQKEQLNRRKKVVPIG